MLEVIRLTTLHPALVHFTIGGLPLVLLGYTMAVWRTSERWSFVGDVALVTTAVLTVATLASGLLSNAMVAWPGGVGRWRWLHLGFGVASTLLVAGFAAARFWVARRAPADGRTLAASAAISLVVAFTGWIGGEVLVFHSGVAVKAAGEGALSPPVSEVTGPPRGMVQAMGQMRASWAGATAAVAQMIAGRPRDRTFDAIARDAASLRRLAGWLAKEGPRLSWARLPATLTSVTSRSDVIGGAESLASQSAFVDLMASLLDTAASDLQKAAEARDLEETSRAMSDVSATCVGCHEQLRWSTF